MTQAGNERLQGLVAAIEGLPGLLEGLPGQERSIVRAALSGQDANSIAADQGISVAAVWDVLGNAARAATGQTPAQPVVTGGLGSDPGPGDDHAYGNVGLGVPTGDAPIPLPDAAEDGLPPLPADLAGGVGG